MNRQSTNVLICILSALLQAVSAPAQSLYRNMGMHAEDFLLNSSPVKGLPINVRLQICHQQNNRYGIIDIATGDTIIPFLYDSIKNDFPGGPFHFYNKIAAVRQNEKMGVC